MNHLVRVRQVAMLVGDNMADAVAFALVFRRKDLSRHLVLAANRFKLLRAYIGRFPTCVWRVGFRDEMPPLAFAHTFVVSFEEFSRSLIFATHRAQLLRAIAFSSATLSWNIGSMDDYPVLAMAFTCVVCFEVVSLPIFATNWSINVGAKLGARGPHLRESEANGDGNGCEEEEWLEHDCFGYLKRLNGAGLLLARILGGWMLDGGRSLHGSTRPERARLK